MLAGLPWGGPARAGAVGGRASADPLTQGIGNFIKALDGGPHEAHSYETPHFDTVTCRFEAGGMQMQFLNSITQMVPAHPESRPRLMGRMRT